MSNVITIVAAAKKNLKEKEPYASFTDGQLSIIESILYTFAIQSSEWETIVTPADLLGYRARFVRICRESLMGLRIAEIKARSTWKSMPAAFVRVIYGRRVNKALISAERDIINRLGRSFGLPMDMSNGQKLQHVFELQETIPSDVTFEQLLCEYPRVLVDCVGWQKMLNQQ